MIDPFFLAALNTAPREGSAALAGAVIRETLAVGGRNYRPMIAAGGLSNALVTPALRFIESRGGSVVFGRRLRKLTLGADRRTALDFGETAFPVNAGDGVTLAVPPLAAGALVPDLTPPTEFCAIVTAHFRIDPPAGCPPMSGVVNGLVQWLFAFPGRLSVTISAADRL